MNTRITPRTLRLAACLLALWSWSLQAEEIPSRPFMPRQLDLEQAVAMANTYNPVINRARERKVEQTGKQKATESIRLPRFDAFGFYQVDDEERLGSFGGPGKPEDEYWRAGVEVRQPIYAGGRLTATVRSEQFQSEALDAAVREAQSRVLATVHRNFYGALLAREVVEVQKESLELLEKQLGVARNRFEAGAGPRFDVLQAEVRVANARPTLIKAINQYRIAIDQLRTSLGVGYERGTSPGDIHLQGSLDDRPPVMKLEQAMEEAMKNRAELIALDRRFDSAEQDLISTKSQRAPQINVYANYGIENDRYNSEADELQGWQAGVEASLAIWEGGRIRGEVAQARSRLQQVALESDALRLSVELEVRTAWNLAEEAKEILEAATLSIAQAEEALRLAENRYSVGSLTQLDVLSSQLEYTRAKLVRVTAVHDYGIALIDLEQAIGRLPGANFIALE